MNHDQGSIVISFVGGGPTLVPRLAALKGGEAKGLEAIERPHQGFLVFYRREALWDRS
jgi:hypothetical protein